MTQAQKRAGSSSERSSDSQANGRCSKGAARQSARSVVLPEPAGAETSVSRVCGAPATTATSPSRGTSRSRTGGARSFVAAMTPRASGLTAGGPVPMVRP